MVSQTNEQALEAAIEKHLTGTCLEEIQAAGITADEVNEPDVLFGEHHGYQLGLAADFNAQYALDEKLFWTFLENTQSDELEKLQRNGADWQRKVLERFDRMMKKYGVVHVLKKGLSVDNAHLHLMYPAPLASSSEKVKKNFSENIFSSMRQVRYSLSNTLEEIDMVLFINGIPIVTLELKNPWTGQTARYHGQKQY
ncbi:MAG: type I restriction endonuclease subunit R, partial [Zetaproteobacteria bacterium]|nr:type I restriction endonuclease subunit R [Zetaproteobacteria bacterium]